MATTTGQTYVPVHVFPLPNRAVGVISCDFFVLGATLPENAQITLEVYSPRPLSPGHLAAIKARFIESLAGYVFAVSAPRRYLAGLALWAVIGIPLFLVLEAQVLGWGSFGAVRAWLYLLLFGSAWLAAGRWLAWRRRVARAERMAARISRIICATGTAGESLTNIFHLWRVAANLDGREVEIVRKLLRECQVAHFAEGEAFYAHYLGRLTDTGDVLPVTRFQYWRQALRRLFFGPPLSQPAITLEMLSP